MGRYKTLKATSHNEENFKKSDQNCDCATKIIQSSHKHQQCMASLAQEKEKCYLKYVFF